MKSRWGFLVIAMPTLLDTEFLTSQIKLSILLILSTIFSYPNKLPSLGEGRGDGMGRAGYGNDSTSKRQHLLFIRLEMNWEFKQHPIKKGIEIRFLLSYCGVLF